MLRSPLKPGPDAHLRAPLLAFLVLNVLLIGLGGDQWLADRLYALQGHAWRLHDGFVTWKAIPARVPARPRESLPPPARHARHEAQPA